MLVSVYIDMIFNWLKTVVLLGFLTGLMLAIGAYFGGTSGLTIALILAFTMNFGMYFFSDKIVLMMYGAKEAKKSEYPLLHKLVEQCANAAGLPKPKVFIVSSGTPNAFATGRNPKHAVIAATTGILSLLNEKELKGVIGHEMSHIKNRDMLITTIAATIAGVIGYMAHFAFYAGLFGGNNDNRNSGLEMIFLIIVTPIIATLLQLAISRSREYLADESGAKLVKNSNSLADALLKLEQGCKIMPMKRGHPATSSLFIVNPFTARGLMMLFSTHPPMTERVKRLRAMKV